MSQQKKNNNKLFNIILMRILYAQVYRVQQFAKL